MHNSIPGLSIRELHGLSSNHVSSTAASVRNYLLQQLELNPKWQYKYEDINFDHWRNQNNVIYITLNIFIHTSNLQVKSLKNGSLALFARMEGMAYFSFSN
jgi:hypothetical protein